MGLQSSTGGEKGLNTQDAAREAEKMLTPGPTSHHTVPWATRSEPTCSAGYHANT